MHIDIWAEKGEKGVSSWKKMKKNIGNLIHMPMPNQLPVHDNISMLIARCKQKKTTENINSIGLNWTWAKLNSKANWAQIQ